MDEKEIANALFSNPDGFFDYLELRKIDLSGLKKLDLPKLFIRKTYKELIKQENFEAAEAVFWLSYFVERDIRDSIFFVETALGKTPSEIDAKLDDMTFGDKIKFVEENYNPDRKPDAYVKVLRSIKTLRNHMAHGRLDKLQYCKYSMADVRGQMKLTIDLMNSMKKSDS